MRSLAATLLALWAGSAAALELDLASNARETLSENSTLDSYFVPTGTFEDGRLPGITVEGTVRRTAFRMASPGLTPLQVLGPLRAQLDAAGYQVLLDCNAAECGGFDFRFSIETLPPPQMYVNLRRFHFLTAIEGPASAPARAVTLLATATDTAAYLQVIQAGDLGDAPDQFTRQGTLAGEPETPTPTAPGTENPQDFLTRLDQVGAALLDDLDFGTGAANLGEGPFETLKSLADLMTSRPETRIAVVGHTDNVGSLNANLTLSRARANAVRARLINSYGIAGARIQADGVAYLAPIATNKTKEGRSQNRRVVVILLQDG